MVAICSDPDVARFTRVPDPYSEADARESFDAQPGRLEAGEGVTCAIVAGGAPVGSVGLRIDPSDADIAEAGYMVGPGGARTRHGNRRPCGCWPRGGCARSAWPGCS